MFALGVRVFAKTASRGAAFSSGKKGHRVHPASEALRVIVGSQKITYHGAVKAVWNYIKVNKLQVRQTITQSLINIAYLGSLEQVYHQRRQGASGDDWGSEDLSPYRCKYITVT